MPDIPKDLAGSLRSWRGSIRKASSSPDLEKFMVDYDQARRDDESARNTRLNGKGSTITQNSIVSNTTTTPEQGTQQQPTAGQTTSRVQLPRLQRADNTFPQGPNQPRKQATFPAEPQTPASTKKSIFHGAPKIADPDPASERLRHERTPLSKAQFYELIGIQAPTLPHQHPRALIIKGGLYERVVTRMRRTRLQYRVFNVTTYVLLVMQLLLSAVFIVLGALGDVRTHLAIAVLGAVSAVVAGGLALMKGQGLPNRLRRFRDGLSAVAFEAEELYWDVLADKTVFFSDIKKVREDFLRIVDVAEKNHPDTWNSFTDTYVQTRARAQAVSSGSGRGKADA